MRQVAGGAAPDESTIATRWIVPARDGRLGDDDARAGRLRCVLPIRSLAALRSRTALMPLVARRTLVALGSRTTLIARRILLLLNRRRRIDTVGTVPETVATAAAATLETAAAFIAVADLWTITIAICAALRTFGRVALLRCATVTTI